MVWFIAGSACGVLGALLLRRIRRGADVHWSLCAVPTGLLWAVAESRHPSPHWLAVTLALSWFAVLLTVTDLRHRRLPDVLTLPAYPVATLLLAAGGVDLALRALVGGVAFGLFHLTIRLASPRCIGGGDVKLAGPLGAILGAVSYQALPLALLLACAITLAIGLTRPHGGIPHGPGLVAATWMIAVFPL